MENEEVFGIVERNHIIDLLANNKRLDGRDKLTSRPFEVEVNVVKKAEGSAKVHLGDTMVLAGVKCELGEPFPDTPDQGVLIINMELSPIASPNYESGPPSLDSIELARVVDRAIRECKVLDVDKLCVSPGEKVWIIFVDIYVLDAHGNLFDASTIAAMAALLTATLPTVKITEENGKKTFVEDEANRVKVPIAHYAASSTFYTINNHLVIDPLVGEERIGDARFTVAFNELGNVCSLQKGLTGTFTKDELFQLIDIGRTKCLETIENIKKKLG